MCQQRMCVTRQKMASAGAACLPSAVTVGDLRDRLLHRLRFGEEAIELFVPLQPDDEEIF